MRAPCSELSQLLLLLAADAQGRPGHGLEALEVESVLARGAHAVATQGYPGALDPEGAVGSESPVAPPSMAPFGVL